MIDLSSPLDITTWKQKGAELNRAIQEEIKGLNDSLIFRPMPSKLLMRQDQYDELCRLNHLPNMYHQEDRMFVTPYNVMEVRVDKRNRLTFNEAHSLDDKAFDKWEKSVKEDKGE